MLEERRASDIKLDAIEKKLDEHSNVLNRMMETIQQIAVQNVHIQSLQAMQSEMRGDINEIYGKISEICSFQSNCPRGSVNNIWKAILAVTLILITVFAGHILGGK